MRTIVSLALLSIASALQAQASNDIHLAVQIRSRSGDPVANLQAHDFKVCDLNGATSSRLALRVTQPDQRQHGHASVPTFLLIALLDPRPSLPAELPAKLGRAWRAGWRVSVLWPNGRQTQYSSSAEELLRELRSPAGSGGIGALTKMAGRQLVFAVTLPGTPLLPQQRRILLQPGISLYHVGGDPWQQEFANGYESTTPPANGGSTDQMNQRSIGPEVVRHERVRGRETEDAKLSAALSDALADAQGYYDLEASIPAGVTLLQFKVAPYGRQGEIYRVDLQPYSEHGPVPQVEIVQPH